ncbi:hypothetical protein HDU98_009112 [Podochytrium sp. JEL0797]|nr:hypothetical protein HDU98_009112 [Podochytrium sp. JEL0797]
MILPLSFPKRMPPASVLRHLAFPPPAAALAATRTLDGEARPPRIPLRMQQRIKKAARLAGLDSYAVPDTMAAPALGKKMFVRMEKGNSRDVEKVKRHFKVEENMAKMDDKIKAWKEEKAKAKNTKRADLPF